MGSGAASLWIASTNFWTTLSMTSGDYLPRFRWKSGLGVAFALYLIVTFAFSSMSIDDEADTFDDGIQSAVSRQLLSAAAGVAMTTVFIIRWDNVRDTMLAQHVNQLP